MEHRKLSVREIDSKDIPHIADYWHTSDDEYLKGMGVDVASLPEREQFMATIASQIDLLYNEKRGYALLWEVDEEPIGHCNVNPVTFGESAYMHFHIWKPAIRRMGYGLDLIKMSLPYFFNNLKLKTLYCEPYALNPAPNKTLQKAGFTFIKEYITNPGTITFEQPVKLWQLNRQEFEKL